MFFLGLIAFFVFFIIGLEISKAVISKVPKDGKTSRFKLFVGVWSFIGLVVWLISLLEKSFEQQFPS